MPKRKSEPIHLNGSSRDFLASYYSFQQKMLDHLAGASKDQAKQEELEKAVAELKTASEVSKTKIEAMDVEMKVVIGLLVTIFLLVVGGFIALFTNGVPTSP